MRKAGLVEGVWVFSPIRNKSNIECNIRNIGWKLNAVFGISEYFNCIDNFVGNLLSRRSTNLFIGVSVVLMKTAGALQSNAVAKIAGGSVLAIGVAVLAGWMLDATRGEL